LPPETFNGGVLQSTVGHPRHAAGSSLPFSPAPLPRRKISFSHGAEWKALISKYIGAIPVSGDASCAAEQSMSGMAPPWIPVSSAMIARLGAAASDIQSAAPSTASPCVSPFRFI
jgi:hypothetical protein